MTAKLQALMAAGRWRDERGVNMLDSGMPFHTTYPTRDGGHMAVGCLEARFYREFVRLVGADLDPAEHYTPAGWPVMGKRIAEAFPSRTREEWTQLFAGSDACVTPVLSLREAAEWPQLASCGAITVHDELLQAAPAPRFSACLQPHPSTPPRLDRDRDEILSELGIES